MKKISFLLSVLCVFSFQHIATAQLPEIRISESTWLAGLIAGGNTSLSSANTLGGWGHFSFGVSGALSRPSIFDNTATASSLSALLRVGAFKGFRLTPGIHGLGSLDLFLRLGRVNLNGLISEHANTWGTGARIGVLRNSIIAPAVSVSVGYHSMGKMPFGSVWTHAIPSSEETEFSTTSFRIDVSKNLVVITPLAGIGVNRNRRAYWADGTKVEQTESESVFYGGVEWNLLVLRLGLEVGRTGGNTFGTAGMRLVL
jgi:hypothetical protein